MGKLDVREVAATTKIRRFHISIFAMCSLVIIFDGYDLAVTGTALPAIMNQMHITSAQAGIMISAALIGMMFGAVVFGILADRFGRRKTIVACIFLFSAFTALSGLADNPVSFGALRFIAGLGIGGAMPNVVAQMIEYSPRKVRSTMVTLMFAGYSVGGILASVMCKALLGEFGWQSVFYIAAFPVLLIPAFVMWMPESLSYLVRTGETSELSAIVSKLDSGCRPSPVDVLPQPVDVKYRTPSVRQLFEDGRAFSTLMIWLAFFMGLFIVYALISWLVKLMAAAGFSLGSALNFALLINVGGIIGGIFSGWLSDRINIRTVLVGMYLLATISIALLGFKVPTWAVSVLVAVAGASTIGTQTLM